MARTRSDWEGVFTTWSQGPGVTEQTKAENAERAIRKAIDASDKLQALQIDVFPQGSYRNRTNVRQESDVDICIRLMSTFHYDLPADISQSEAGFTNSSYTYSTFKNDVEEALVDYLGRGAVVRGNKAFDVHENTYRVDADVVPTFEFREYYRVGSVVRYRSGTRLIPDRGDPIENWPQQHYDRGVEKNDRTRRRFKRTVRILKRLRNEMVGNGSSAARAMPSYLIECLVANVPEEAFDKDSYWDTVRWVLAHVFNNTRVGDDPSGWLEVNEIKYLFRAWQAWTQQDANRFADEAWRYIGFGE